MVIVLLSSSHSLPWEAYYEPESLTKFFNLIVGQTTKARADYAYRSRGWFIFGAPKRNCVL